ncbi:MAG: 50S ribosomal protein L24 [Candidatus Sumerlaeota bacterium]|nr:50S ribosomal protein L24 [Candidatus Sumerlaeota bacterium]
MKTRIKKGDTVEVRSGKDKGLRGRVLAVIPGEGKAVVEHINMARRHRKRRSARDQGGIVSIEKPMPLCKLMLLSDDRPTRVRIETDDKGESRRISVRTGKVV